MLAPYTGSIVNMNFGGAMSKKIAALVAAILSTACVGVMILLIGGAALFNPSGTVAAQSPAQASSVSSSRSASSQAQVQQLQALVQQYQAREQQYQSRDQQMQQQLQADNQTVQQAQQQMQEIRQLLQALQERGLITITPDGQIEI